MSSDEQINHFANDIDALVDRYRSEYDMTYAAVVGVLFMKSHLLCNEAKNSGDNSGLTNDAEGKVE